MDLSDFVKPKAKEESKAKLLFKMRLSPNKQPVLWVDSDDQKMNSLAYCDKLHLLFVSTSQGILILKLRFVFRDFEEVQQALVCSEVVRTDH